MTVLVDGDVRVSLAQDLVSDVFAGDPAGVMFGFAASTGGLTNEHKFCPKAPDGFTVPADPDGDGVDSSLDKDDDNDGIADSDEVGGTFTGDPSADHDTDGIQNWQDPDYWDDVLSDAASCPDNVAPIGACDSIPTSIDSDADGTPNHLDADSDADGVKDAAEAGGTDANGNGVPDNCGTVDSDGRCAGGLIAMLPNTDNGSPGGDNLPDYRDADDDADGVATLTECGGHSPCSDSDNDGTPDNLDQDSDNDGVLDGADTDPTNACSPSVNASACTDGGVLDAGTDAGNDAATTDGGVDAGELGGVIADAGVDASVEPDSGVMVATTRGSCLTQRCRRQPRATRMLAAWFWTRARGRRKFGG